jgi:hypothetical protein
MADNTPGKVVSGDSFRCRNDAHTHIGPCTHSRTRRHITEPITSRTRLGDVVIGQLSVRHVVILGVEVRDAPAPLAPMRLEVMRQLEDPTSPRASGVLQEHAERRRTAITAIVAYTCNVLSIREPSIAINALDRPRERASGTSSTARSSTVDTESSSSKVQESGKDEQSGGGDEAHEEQRVAALRTVFEQVPRESVTEAVLVATT